MQHTSDNAKVNQGAPVLRSVSIVSIMTAISRVLGLVREAAMAYFFGTSAIKSAFDIAFLIPNLFRRLFGEGALSSAFVPVYSELTIKEGRQAAYHFACQILTLLITILGVTTLGGILLTYVAEPLLSEGSRWLLPLPMIRIMLPYALLICVAALLSGMLNTAGKFAISSLTPFLLNLLWLVTLFGIFPFISQEPSQRIMLLSWTVLAAGVAQAFFQLPVLYRSGFRFKACFTQLMQSKHVRRTLSLMAPAALGLGLIQINVCIDKMLAFWADPGAPAMLEYAERLIYLPLGMFGTAFMTVLLPTFSKQFAGNNLKGMQETLERAIRNLSVIMAPCSIAMGVLALPLIKLIYSYRGGELDHNSAVLCARALSAYAPGLLMFSFQKALLPAFYAMQDLRTPVKVSLYGLLLNITMNVASVFWLPVGWKHAGIAGSTVITSIINGIMLACILFKKHKMPQINTLALTLIKSLVASIIMIVAAQWILAKLCGFSADTADNKILQVVSMAITIVVSMAIYAGIMFTIAREEMGEIMTGLRSKRKGRRDV